MTITPNYGAIQPAALITRQRNLPRPGEVLVTAGQTVSALEVVARSTVAQGHHIIDIADQLSVTISVVNRYILKQVGETVEQNEPLAARRSLAGLRRYMVRSPIEGEIVESEGGILIVAGEPHVIELRASIPGRVIDVKPSSSVTIETQGARIRAAWGHGQLVFNDLKIYSPQPIDPDNPDGGELDEIEHRGSIVAILAPLTQSILDSAQNVHVAGIIAASMDATLISQVEQAEFPVILSEGFGQYEMNSQIATLLNENGGRQIMIDAASDQHWRSTPPEIIIPMLDADGQFYKSDPGDTLEIGQSVRILRGPHRGAIATVKTLPARPRQLPSGLWLKGVIASTEGGQDTFIPFANLEHLG